MATTSLGLSGLGGASGAGNAKNQRQMMLEGLKNQTMQKKSANLTFDKIK